MNKEEKKDGRIYNGDKALNFFTANKNVLSDGFLKLESDIKSINDYSAGLSVGISNPKILSDYVGVLGSQKVALDSILQINEKLTVEGNKISSLLDTTVRPIASVVADIGLVSANATKLFGIGSISAIQLQSIQNISETALKTIQGQQDIFNESLAAVKDSGILNLGNEISSLKFVSSGIGEMVHSLPTFPLNTEELLPSLKISRESLKLSREEKSELQYKLDELLYKIDPDLVEFRSGVWNTFNSKGDDYIGQSSSSMRRLIDNLLRALAPQEKVIETNFFKTSKKAKDEKGRPTRKAKILYLLNWDKNKADQLMRVVVGFLESYDNLSAWDHNPTKQDSFVHGTLTAIEGHLLSILTEAEE
jgi:hypothetical protein